MAARPLGKKGTVEAFITGSYAYGVPTPKSDIDLVIYCDKETKRLLEEHFSPDSHRDYALVSADNSIRIGKLNLITCISIHDYNFWKQGTEELKQQAPIKTKRVAIDHFENLRKGK